MENSRTRELMGFFRDAAMPLPPRASRDRRPATSREGGAGPVRDREGERSSSW